LRILLTNDDGINAEGFQALEKIASELSDDLWMVAPEAEQSGASRALTLSEPLRVRQLDERRFAVGGTPCDCVTLALMELIDGPKPDLVLSGVNRGHNVAEDVSMSGTVAGALAGMALGVPSIALSQGLTWKRGEEPAIHFDTAETFGPGLVRRLVEVGWPAGVIMNVNFPGRPPEEVGAVEVTRQAFRDAQTRHFERRKDLRGRDYYWLGYRNLPSKPADGTDLRAIYDGNISVTPLHIDLTHMQTVHDLRAVLGGAPPKL
jgi:5'-nucleotidase